MSKHIRFTALLLAVCFLFNSVAFPAAAEGSLEPLQETTIPTEETTIPVEAATVLTEEASVPIEVTAAPTEVTTAPTEATTVPTEITTAPTEVTTVPTEVTTAPTEVTTAPTEVTTAPTEVTTAPTEVTTAPTEVTTAPIEETTASTEPTLPQPIATGTVVCTTSVNIRSGPGTGYEVLDSAYNGQQVLIFEIVPTQEGNWGRIGEGRWICLTYVLLDGQEPTEETTTPTEETAAPTEETTAPTEETTDSTEETTDPTEETTAPTEETTAPTEETTAPTEETTDPTEETTDPLSELETQLAAISVSIQLAQVIPQKMSLTWWAMNCSKMQVDYRLAAENMLAVSPEGVVLPQDTIPQELLYQPEDSTLLISSARDLAYLSYVDPLAYQQMTLRFLPSQQENRGFYLIDPIEELRFSPLGSLEAPFQGKLIFQEQTGPIQLDCPLFDTLSDEAAIESLILECRAEEAMENGLLAKRVVHTQGGADWEITLSAPVMEEDTVAILPPLVGSLGSECDVALELTNDSSLPVIGSGLLCAQMGANAKFTVSGLTALPPVTGFGENVGGLVGFMNAGAELTVLGEVLSVSSVIGSTNAGGLIGSALDPVLSLPTVAGAESALITGENAGGIIGNLAYSTGDHTLTLAASNLQINGRANAGGLVGLLSNENGQLVLTASAEEISFGTDALGCTGQLIGSYLAPQMTESLVLHGEAAADEASLVDLIGNAPPAEEASEPTEETTDPTEETTDPAEETTAPKVTEEEIQAMLDEVMSAEIQPGKMSLTWWAVVSGKVTAESIMAEINGTATEPTEEPAPTENTEATEATIPTEYTETTEATIPTEYTEATEATIPTEYTEATEATIPTEYTEATEATIPTEYTEATEATAAAEPTTEPLPTEAPVPFESAPIAEEITFPGQFQEEGAPRVVFLSTFQPFDASLSQCEAAALSLSSTEENVENTTDNTANDNESGTESEDYGISLFSGKLEDWGFSLPDPLKIYDSEELIRLSLVDANEYQNIKLEFINQESGGTYNLIVPYKDENNVEYPFLGLGSTKNPFQGTFIVDSSTSINIKLNRSLFNAISDKATLPKMTLTWDSTVTGSSSQTSGGKDAVLASRVFDSETSGSTWEITLSTESGSTPNLLPILGTMESDSQVSLAITDNIKVSKTVIQGGYLCGTMGSGAKLTVSGISSIPAVKTSSGNAGGLVGTMQSEAELTVNSDSLALFSVTTDSGSAGGLAGEMQSGAKLEIKPATDGTPSSLTLANVTASANAGGLVGVATDPKLILPATSGAATITGDVAGGRIGCLTITQNKPVTLEHSIQDLTLNGTTCSGGLYGELHNNGVLNAEGKGVAFTIAPPENGTSTVSVTLSGAEVGGLIGKYETTRLENALEIKDISVTAQSGATWFGGVIGNVSCANAAYVKLDNVTASLIAGGNPTNFGGLIGKLSDSGHMVEVGAANISSQCASTGIVGGLVGQMPSGVLLITHNLTGESTGINLSNIESAATATRGWILGNRGNTLVYTTAAEWNDARGSNTNDTGCWGQVLRVEADGKLAGLLSPDSSAHTVSVQAISNTVANEKDFAAVALRMQLDPKNALVFTGGDVTGSTISISLTNSINLDGTGLTGLTRDINTTPLFGVTITGSGDSTPTITLPSIKVYVSTAHNRQGLLAKVNALDVTNVTLASPAGGAFQIHVLDSVEPYIGMLVAEITGDADTTLTNVTSSVKLSISSTGKTLAKVGGIIGVLGTIASKEKTLTFDGCTWDGTITDTCSGSTYVGGFMSFVNGDGGRYNRTVNATNCTVSGSITKEAYDTAYIAVGGFICTLYYGYTTLNIDGLDVRNVTVDVTAKSGGTNATSCGGLLSYEWIQTTATVKRVTITNCTLNSPIVNSTPQFGGLLYKGDGYWQIGTKDGSEAGITFVSGNTITGYSNTSYPSSLFLCRGDMTRTDALYMEVYQNGYKINQDAVEVNLSGDTNTFDELVGTTIRYASKNNVSYSVSGIVSIATSTGTIDQSSLNTYKNQLSDKYTWKNPKTRYYYNLDTFRLNPYGGEGVDTPQEMVVLSAWGHCHSKIQKYFSLSSRRITGSIDLTGYSYYPIPVLRHTVDNDNVVTTTVTASVENADITFDVAGLQDKEDGNKRPLDSTRQHYGMHTGIFTDAEVKAAASSTLTVNGLTLRGTVGGSAIINGMAKGNASTAMMKLSITGVKLAGIRTVKADGSLLPLLINNIKSFTSLELTDVTTINAYEPRVNFTHAATSLIGIVGETDSSKTQVGQYIQLDFSQIALDGRINADSNNTPLHNTTHSIFSQALFLKDFQYTDTNSWGIYNFTKTTKIGENDLTGYYTLGEELSNGEADDNVRNGGEQFWFYGTEDYVYYVEKGITEGDGSEATTFFKNNKYRRYVYNRETSTYHEMDINLFSMDITIGCGTYSDPYIITFGKQLSAVADVLNGRKPKKNWAIKLNDAVLSSGLSSQDGHTKGNDNGTDGVYTWNGIQWGQDGPDESAVIEYLRNAYYRLEKTVSKPAENGNSAIVGNDGTIKLSANWGGLGSNAHPFQGVIVSDGAVTVQINTPNAARFGGLVAFSQGSVVKNVKLHYQKAPTITCTSAPSSIDAPFFGGVVGWCMGGDTIIDGVTITYADGIAPSITGTMKHLVPVGGYVGLVGGTEGLNSTTNGLGGGVVFRNISTSSLPELTVGGVSVTPSDNDSSYFYVNPYVGRVLDGYALSEGNEITNTDKNYTIPSLTSPGLTYQDGKIIVSDGAGLWLLSAIVNSGAGSVNTVRAYSEGKARFRGYDNVGSGSTDAERDDEASNAAPYLIRHFSLADGFQNITASAVSIQLTGDCDMTTYGNGFRGIGGSYGTTKSNRMLTLTSVTGTNTSEGKKPVVTLGQTRKEYTDEAENWTSIGAGLFPVLNPDDHLTVSNLSLKGETGITYYASNGAPASNPIPGDKKLMDEKNSVSGANIVYRLGCSGAGLLAGTLAYKETSISSISLTDISLSGSVNGSATFAGGLIGLACINKNASSYIGSLTVTNCSYQDLSVSGHASVSGFLGYVYAKNLTIEVTKDDIPLSNLTLESENCGLTGAKTGVGGLIGRCDTDNLFIGGKDDAVMTFSGPLTITNGYSGSVGNISFSGGLGGMLGIRKLDKGTATIQNIAMNANVTISNTSIYSISGALAGALANYSSSLYGDIGQDGWALDNAGEITAAISNIDIAASDTGSVAINKSRQCGTLFGWLKVAESETVDIDIGSVTLASEVGSEVAMGGLFGKVSHANPLNLSAVTLKSANIWGTPNSATGGAALLVGYAEQDADIKVRDILMQNCSVAVNNHDANAGFLYAHLDGSSMAGYNILIEGCTVGLSLNEKNQLTAFTGSNGSADRIGLATESGNGYSYKPYSALGANDYITYNAATSIAIFGGIAENKDAKLVGVSLQGCFTPAKDFGETSATKYAIRADYAGAAGVAQDVTIKPEGVFPGINGNILTSDGIAFASDNTTPLAQRIVQNYWGDTLKNRTYFNVPDAMKFFNTNPGYFSTYETGGMNELPMGGMDFPVLIINASEPDPTGVVMNYISILTNQAETQASHVFSSITAKTYVVPFSEAEGTASSAFQADDTNKSLIASPDGTITIVADGYDNERNQFTLLDVQYADPTDSTKPPYHLYIPVIVKKILEYRFWAAALMGTAYTVDAYGEESVKQLAIGSNGEQVTLLLSFEYQRKPKEWQAVIDKGENLLWNFNKCIILDNVSQQGEATGTLPTGTKLTLVDRGNAKAYFGVSNELLDGNTLYFSRFGGWEQPFLCDGLDLTYAPDDAGKFIEVAKDADPTLRAADAQGEFHYFRLATDEGEEVQRYSITVGKELKEQYYLTIQTPAATEVERNSIVNMVVKCPSKLPNPENGGLPTRLVPNEGGNDRLYARFGNENRFVLGNFFTQRITVTAKSNELINNDANIIQATMEATIQFVDGQKNNYMIWANGQDLHQQFKLFLQFTHPTNSTDTPRNFADGTKLTVTFQNGETVTGSLSEYLSSSDSAIRLKFPGSIPVDQMDADGLTLTAEVELEFSPSAIVNQFEPGTSDLNHPGITVWGETCLAYSEAALDYSSQRKEAGDTSKRYYRDNTEPATLRYNAHENLNGSVVTGVSRLGVNGLEDEVFSIPTAGIYDVSALSDAAKATQLRCSLRLEQKGQDGNYLPVNIGDYLSVSGISAVVTNAGVERTLKAVSESNFTYTFNLGDGFSKEVPIQIPVDLEVITGTAFEAEKFQYANYKVVLTAELYIGDEAIRKSSANDYIIYTNAKIKFDLIS